MSEKRIRPTEEEMEKNADELIALLRGEPGPFLENETSFFGKKRVDPSMKEAFMETDCGGALITKAKMTYGEADELARTVELTGFSDFLSGLQPSCYWKPREDGSFYIGNAWWVVYSFLATQNAFASKRDPKRYDNALEYLYDEVLKRLVCEGVLQADAEWRFFRLPEPQP